ncbi:jg17901 [Pararge aegeria aegeria]|uniref:Jg17901 protein n=1 Tax=Pararge aegeria aegeria TaxID=348720 RepID=A0A8S4SJ72_9NEOP|nr:jg17901 [Pararge aegeria aegeria]
MFPIYVNDGPPTLSCVSIDPGRSGGRAGTRRSPAASAAPRRGHATVFGSPHSAVATPRTGMAVRTPQLLRHHFKGSPQLPRPTPR